MISLLPAPPSGVIDGKEERIMFTLTVTEKEIQDTLETLNRYVYPVSINLYGVAWNVFKNSFEIGEIEKRKVRLCIAELQNRGHLIIAKRGYSMAGDDPEPVIHYLNGLYSRKDKLTKKADCLYHQVKQKYGDAVALKVEQLPGQPAIPFNNDEFDDHDVLFFGAGRVA